jgi:DNA mismatch repair ATPase MutS
VAHPLLDREQIRARQSAVTEAVQCLGGAASLTAEDVMSGKAAGAGSDWITPFVELLKKLPDLEKGLSRIQYGKIKPSEFYVLIQAFQRSASSPIPSVRFVLC